MLQDLIPARSLAASEARTPWRRLPTMATPEHSFTDPLTLLPTILKHLTSLQKKPSLASSVLASVRKAFCTSKAQPFITPLLPPLTAIALTSSVANVRRDAAFTCAALLRGLVSRRVSPIAAAYVTDLVALARSLIENTSTDPPECNLPLYSKLARSANNYDIVFQTKTATIPITPQSLEAIFELISQFIPPTESQTTRHALAQQDVFLALSPRLWRCIGESARATILDLASSYVLLSGSCGDGPVRAATKILERALEHATACTVPTPIRMRVISAVETVLREGFPPSKNSSSATRASLYRVAQLASIDSSISAELWSSCGIREAAVPGSLGDQLMNISNRGMVRPFFKDSCEEWREEGSSHQQPPRKRRRISQIREELTAGEKVSSVDSSQIPIMDPSQEAVTGLKRTIQSLKNIYVCAEDASSMRLLGKACLLTADSLKLHARHEESISESFRHWSSFASALALIVRDVSIALKPEATPHVWEASMEFSQYVICLISGLCRVASICTETLGKPVSGNAESTMTAIDNLVTGLTKILVTAALALDSSPDFPVIALGDVLFEFGGLVFSNSIESLEDASLLNACLELQKKALNGCTFSARSQAALIRGSVHLLFSFSKISAADQGLQALPKLTDLLITNVTAPPEVVAATTGALSDALCMIVECRHMHGSPLVLEDVPWKSLRTLDAETWTKCNEAIGPYLEVTAGRKVLGSSLRCFGSLVLHGPLEKISDGASMLSSMLWRYDAQECQDLVYCYLRDLVQTRTNAKAILLGEHVEAIRGSRDGAAQMKRSRQPSGPQATESLGALLLRKIKKHTNNWEKQQDSSRDDALSTQAYAAALIMRLTSDIPSLSEVLGETLHALLFASLVEFTRFRSHISRTGGNRSAAERTGVSGTAFDMKTWFVTLRAISHHSGHFTRVNQERKDRLYDTKQRRKQVSSACRGSYQTLAQIVTTFLTSRFRDWLPCALPRMLNDPSIPALLSQILTDGDIKALWLKVPRHTMEHLLKAGNIAHLDLLASNVGQSHATLVEKVCADAFANAFIEQDDLSEGNSKEGIGFILSLLQQSPHSVVSKRAGKIVQKLVMQFGTSEEPRAISGLILLSKMLAAPEGQERSAQVAGGALLSQHFMLVMDAVNRGLFHSKATSADRFRYLRMLEVVVSMASSQLHLFVPKILATLKLALETGRGNQKYLLQTLRVWVGFLETLGSKRMIPHLGSILSTVLPYYERFHDILAPSLNSLVEKCAGQQINDHREIVLLLKVTDHEALTRSARILEANLNGIPTLRHANSVQASVSVEDLAILTRSVGNIIAHFENGSVEVLCVKYLLRILRNSREYLCSAAAMFGRYNNVKPPEDVVALASISGALVDLLTRTKNAQCQHLIMQCIGEVGAIDPAIVSDTYESVVDGEEQESCVLSTLYPGGVHALVALLLDNFLVPTLTKGEQQHRSSSGQNRVGLVIQELLRVCGCQQDTARRASKSLRTRMPGGNPVEWDKVLVGETKDENAIFFWENLLSTTRNVAEPYLAEPFDVQYYRSVFGANSAGDTQSACQAVWARVKGATLAGQTPTAHEWRRQMTVQLVDFIGKQGSFGDVLKALRPVLRYEDDVAAFTFPLVIATALDIQHGKQSSDFQKFLMGEIAQVMEEGLSPQPLFVLFDTLRHWRDQRCTDQARMTMTTNPGAVRGLDGSGSSRKKVPLEAYVEQEKDRDHLSPFIDLHGREDSSLSLLLQAKSAFRAKSYSRTVMMAECHIRNLRNTRGFAGWPSFVERVVGKNESSSDSNTCGETEALRLLQKAFAELEDAASMTGIAALRGASSLSEQVIDCEAAGRYDEALATYERAIAVHPRTISFHEGFLGCLMTLGHWESMLSHAKGLLSSSKLIEMELRESAKANGIAAAWRLGRWTEIEEFHHDAAAVGSAEWDGRQAESWPLRFSLSLGRMFLSLREGKVASLHHAANDARMHILDTVVKAAREGYSRAYPMIALLHSISDIEDSCQGLEGADDDLMVRRDGVAQTSVEFRRLISFPSRLQASKPTLKAREPLISVKRVCFELLQKPNDAANANIDLARHAREGDNLHAASASVYRAMSAGSIDNHVQNATVLEMSRIRRAQGDCSVALKIVKGEVGRLSSVLKHDAPKGYKGDFVKETSDRLCTALNLAGSWIEETRGEPSEVILSYFGRAATYGPSREEPFYSLGRHYDSLLQASANSDEKNSATADLGTGRALRRPGQLNSGVSHHSHYVPLVIKSFAKALVNGHARIFEALPRMLTVWFDYHTELDDPNAGGNAVLMEADVKKEMKKAFDTVPGYMWMTAVPQIMSRILHPRKQVREDLTNLLARLVCLFPDQCFWTILPSTQLKTVERKKAAGSVLNHAITITKKKGKAAEARENARVLRARIQSALSVVNSFVCICMQLLPKEKRGRKENCSREFRELKTYLRTNMAMNPVIPTLDSLTTRLPYGEVDEHRPFEVEPVRIVDIEDHVLVMVSLMRPRRIGLVGSDGHAYRYLAKKENQGDMRKDSRLVELIIVVNRLLSKNTGSREKRLGLKTYAVLPLSEETGMIEWVNDLAPLRNVVRDEHNRLATVPDTQQIQRNYQAMKSHREFLMTWAFQKFPPVLDKFFLHQFGQNVNAEAWLEARNLWTESTAVWSMVGYVVGLGDRHGENVLLETTSGRCVHVDFAMLFDKGLKLKVPEIVPFRLTRNMVTAMGIAGYEGVYRAVSECVLEMMREKADAVLGVLESFLHDPLADWGRGEARVNKGGILATKEAWQTRAAVKAKLTGMVDSSGIPLSIKGQVQRLIQEATNVDNLSEMYLWWSAWI